MLLCGFYAQIYIFTVERRAVLIYNFKNRRPEANNLYKINARYLYLKNRKMGYDGNTDKIAKGGI